MSPTWTLSLEQAVLFIAKARACDPADALRLLCQAARSGAVRAWGTEQSGVMAALKEQFRPGYGRMIDFKVFFRDAPPRSVDALSGRTG